MIAYMTAKQPILWISSVGGPLILMNRESLPYWNGNSLLFSTNPGVLTDYERACAIDDFVGILSVNGLEALVLGDLPSDTTFRLLDERNCLLIRWIGAESDDAVTLLIREIMSNKIHGWTKTTCKIQVTNKALVLFDSVCKGNELSDSSTVECPNGAYVVFTLSYRPNPETNFFLIRLMNEFGVLLDS
jgi:hypothetical protein